MSSSKEIIWIDPQTGKKWYRRGKCKHCGGCCTTWCPYLYFEALRDIKKGEKFFGAGEDYGNILLKCAIFDKDITVNTPCIKGCTLKTRKEFPSSPLITPPKCGFYWVDEEGNKWRREEHDYSKGVLK